MIFKMLSPKKSEKLLLFRQKKTPPKIGKNRKNSDHNLDPRKLCAYYQHGSNFSNLVVSRRKLRRKLRRIVG
jgi:hypothetical protein